MSVVNRLLAAILVLGCASASSVLLATDSFRSSADGRRVDQSDEQIMPPAVPSTPDLEMSAVTECRV